MGRKVLALVLWCSCAAWGQRADSTDVKALLERIDRLEKRVAELEAKQAPASASSSGDAAQELSGRVTTLEAEVAEQAQTKVESESRFPVKIAGTVLFGAHYNAGVANWVDNPNIAGASTPGLPDGSFTASLRQTRLGFELNGPQLGSFRTSGFVAFDFFGGISDFQTGPAIGLPRLLYAFARFEGERNAFEVGQDQAIFAPKNPTSLAAFAFPELYRSGNLYLREPQARWEYAWRGESGTWQLLAGATAPISGDYAGPYAFVPPKLAGELSRQPAFQARLGWKRKVQSANGTAFEVGLSGHRGQERYLGLSSTSWGGAADLDLQRGRFGLGGEWYAGQNLDQFGGGMGQFARSTGGWLEARWQATRKASFNGGYGTDRPFDRTLFPVTLKSNQTVFANTIYHFSPEIAGSFEYRWLQTTTAAGDARDNHHLDVVLSYSF